MSTWKVGASRSLPIASDAAWDGGAAEAAIFEWAGGDDFNSEKARKGFLVYDSEKADERGSYKLPFAIVSGGSLKASPAGIRAAANRLPQTDIPADVKTEAEAVVDHYEERMGIGDHDGDGEGDDKAAPVWRKSCEPFIKGVNPDTDDTMDAINSRFALQPLKAEDVFLGQMHLANTQYDRSEERFPKAYLDRFAETLPGKSVMTSHDYQQVPVGRFYDAQVRKDVQNGGHFLLAKFYLAADGPVTNAVKLGIASHASIGFLPDKRICDLCNKDYDGWYAKAMGEAEQADDDPCTHIVGRIYGGKKCTLTYGGDTQKVEAQEGSLVWLGCQRGAMTMRSGPPAYARKEAVFDSLAEKAGGKGDTMDKELAAALARVKELETEMDRLKPLAADGKAYRDWQKAEILRLHSSMDEVETGKVLVKALDTSTAEELEKVRTEVDTRHAKAFAKAAAQSGVSLGDQVQAASSRTIDEILSGAGVRRRES